MGFERFINYLGKQRTLNAMVRHVLPTKQRVQSRRRVFGMTLKGLRSSVARQFVAKCEQGRKVIYFDEHRSSILDSYTHCQMYHPPKLSPEGKLWEVTGL